MRKYSISWPAVSSCKTICSLTLFCKYAMLDIGGRMPYRAPRPCREPGCPGYAVRRGWCAYHARMHESEYDKQRGSAAERGYDSTWRELRARFLHDNPYCVICGKPATDVHHILPRAAGGTDDWSNLEALCHACHSAITERNDKGKGY